MKFFISGANGGVENAVRMGRQIFGLGVSNLAPAFAFGVAENWFQGNL